MLLYIKDGQILSTLSKGKDTYYLPGGKRELNETDKQTLIRECKEELTIDIKNEKCKEICYILEGKGAINKKEESINFEQGDVILIEKEEIYYWNGNCKIIMICTPSWYKEQCKLLDL